MNKRFIVFLSSRKSWTLPYIIFSAIFVIIPLFLIVVYAFTDDSGHLTLANFQKFFEHPEAIIWYDGWVIPKYARNPEAASYFINFMCRPDIALRNMDFCGYVSSIATPEILEEKIDTTLHYYSDLSYFFGPGADSVQIDKIQYPDRKVVERCAMIRDFGDKTKEVLDIWSRIKGDNLGVGITILIFVVVALMSGWMIYKKWQRYNRQKQQRRRSRRKKVRRN